MSDAAASDDSDLRNIVHAGTPLTATSLALAEKTGASGKDVLAAIVLGYEAAGRMGEAIIPRFDFRGHHGCMGAAFAATGAAVRLLGLDARQAAHAIVLTATSIGGVTKAADTSVSREYHAGAVTVAGIEASLAAKRGFTGELKLLEMERGFCQVFGGPEADAASITRDLGKSWDIVTDMAIKLVPGAHPYHALAEAAANAAREGNIAPGDIAAIVVSRPGWTSLPGPKHPDDLISMAHSPAFFVAAGAHDKRFGWEHAGAENRGAKHPRVDRQGPRRPAAGGCDWLSPGRHDHDRNDRWPQGDEYGKNPEGRSEPRRRLGRYRREVSRAGAECAVVEGEDRGEPEGDQGAEVGAGGVGAGGAVGLAPRSSLFIVTAAQAPVYAHGDVRDISLSHVDGRPRRP